MLQDVAFMIAQSHNLKGKMEATVQTVVAAQELWLKAALVDLEELAQLQDRCELVKAEGLFGGAFWCDVRQMVNEWRALHGLPEEPLAARRRAAMSSASAPSEAAGWRKSVPTHSKLGAIF